MASTGDTKQTSGKWQCTVAKKREKLPTKVVIRRLPPAIEKDSLLNQISPLPDYDYFYLVNGEAALGENSFSRAYINFTNIIDVYEFKERFDNYVFLDDRGYEYPAVVEFAPFQKIPRRNKVRSDPKCGTIESDPYYLKFLENLNKPKELDDKSEYSYQVSPDNKDKNAVTTPLLEFVRSRRARRMRIREERRQERMRKERRVREAEKKKRSEEKFMSKSFSKMKLDNKDMSYNDEREEGFENSESKNENFSERSSSYKIREGKFEERKTITKVTSPRKEFVDKREFKNSKEQFKEPKVDPSKREEIQVPKKAKKYSEKREERKIEAQKKAEELEKKGTNPACLSSEPENEKETCEKIESFKSIKSEEVDKTDDNHMKSDNTEEKIQNKSEVIQSSKENTPECQKIQKDSKVSESEAADSVENSKEHKKETIRNKDQLTIAIYTPGMLFKRNLVDGDDKESTKDSM